MRRDLLGAIFLLMAGAAGACGESPAPTALREIGTRDGPLWDNEYVYEDSYLSVSTEGWEPDPSMASEEIEIVAEVQSSFATDGRRECPVDQFYAARAPLRKVYYGEVLDFEFRGPFAFVRHVARDGSSPWPTAIYRFHSNAHSQDGRYYAPAGNSVLLACDGRYRWNNSFLRVWSGHLYGREYNGPIVRNYADDSGGGNCDDWRRAEETAQYDGEVYSPAPEPGGSGCGSGSGYSGGEPLAEDEWYAWYEGIRFRCHRVQDNTGTNIISCTVDDGS